MQNIFLQRCKHPLLLLLLLCLPPFAAIAINTTSLKSYTSEYLLDAPQLQARPSLVGANWLTWMPVSGASGYELEVSNTGLPATFVKHSSFGPSVRSYRHTGLYYSQKVYYRLKALGTGNDFSYSAVVSSTTNPAGKVYRIMPLGDSNTEGGRGDAETNLKVSYRARLAQLLDGTVSRGKYDFVGSQRSGASLATDIDHAGFGGATIQNISDLLRNRSYGGTTNSQGLTYLQEYQPDVILLHIGTNDADGSDAAIMRLEGLLNEIDKYEASSGKDVTVILAKIIKRVCYNDVFVSSYNCYTPKEAEATLIYNSKMATMAQNRRANGDNLLLVDMQDGAGIIYKWASDGGDMSDPLHPTQPGYDKMAPVWFAELDKLLNVQPVSPPDTEAPETTILTKPAALTNSTSATFSFGSNESNVVYLASIDGGTFTEVPNPFTITGLTDGSHAIEVKAKDAAGNIDESPATYTWTVDTQAPAAPVVLNPAEGVLLNNNKPAISGTAEADATVTVLNKGAQLGTTRAGANGNWTFTPTASLPEGVQQITAKATDEAGNTGNSSNTRQFTVDTQAPETTIATKPDILTNKTTAQFTFTSNEAGVSFEASLNGGAYVAAVGNTYTLNNLTDGTYTLSARATDAAGNKDATPATYTWTVDTQAPAAPLLQSVSEDLGPLPDDEVTADNSLLFKGTAEAFSTVELIESGNSLGQTTANAAGNWELDHTSSALPEGTYTFTATATDRAGNKGNTSAAFPVTIDLTPPDVVLSTSQASPVNATFEVTVTFTEQVYGLELSDFIATNGNLTNLQSINSTAYKVTVNPAADGLVKLSLANGKVTDLAGNLNTASNSLEVKYDGTPPQVSINSVAPAITKEPFTVTLTFTEEVTGFELQDVTPVNATLSEFKALDAKTYTLLVSPVSDGEVSIRVAAGKAFDATGNGNVASEVFKRLYDVQQPGVVLSTLAPSPTNQPFAVEVVFSEAVTGFDLTDIVVSNGTAAQLKKGTDKKYTFNISPAANGEVRVLVGAGAAADMAGNPSIASNELVLQFDNLRPGIVLSTASNQAVNKPFTVKLELSEAVTDLSLNALALSNATASGLQKINDLEYTFVVTPAQDGEVTVQVPADKVHDAATNGNTASNLLRMLYDVMAPDKYSVAFGVQKVDVSNQTSVSLQVTGAEVGATYFYTIASNNGTEQVSGTAVVATSGFTIVGIDLSDLADGTLTVSLYLVDEAGNKGTVVTAQAEKLTKNIVSVEALASIKVPFNTAFNKVPLPEQVSVTYATQEQESIKVSWQQGDYNAQRPGMYTLKGILTLSPKTSNTGKLTASITVEVEPNKAPTAISLSTDTFKPNILPTEVIGTFSTTDPDDTEFTYSLVAGPGDTDNNLFEILNNNNLHLKTNNGLSGKTKFTIRVQSMDAYQNKIEREFILTKTPFDKPDIKLVNAFSPDGDGINDTWVVPELRYYNNVEVEIFDRAGIRVFHTKNPEEGWDGRSNSGQVLQDSYFYIIRINDLGHVQKGVVTVLK